MTSRFHKPTAIVQVADGAGGLYPLDPQGFDDGAWSVQRVIPAQDADEWMAQWHAIAESRGWSGGRLSELHAEHNAGSITVRIAPGPESPVIEGAWEKLRGGDLQIRVRPNPAHPAPTDLIEGFLAQIDDHVQRRVRDRQYRRGWLCYGGLPWTGEIWLSDQLRLGRPSRFPSTILGPQAVLVDAVVEGIGSSGLMDAFIQVLRDLKLVLSPLVGVALHNGMQSQTDWIPEIDEKSQYTGCRLGPVGYIELDTLPAFPERGTTEPLPLIDVVRPGLEPSGMRPGDQCIKVARDIPDLWQRFCALPPDDRDQFRRACNIYSIAQSLWPDQRTAYAAFLVVACETLKPRSHRARSANLYDVVTTLLGRQTAQRLKAARHPPQAVRSNHLHRGELAGNDLAARLSGDDFRDPSFDEMLWELQPITRQCLIEWLRRGGIHRLVRLPPTSQRVRP